MRPASALGWGRGIEQSCVLQSSGDRSSSLGLLQATPYVLTATPSIGKNQTRPLLLSAGIVGLWSLAILALERYVVVCRPLGDFRFQHRHAVGGCAFTWSWSLLWTTPPLLGWSSYVPEGRGGGLRGYPVPRCHLCVCRLQAWGGRRAQGACAGSLSGNLRGAWEKKDHSGERALLEPVTGSLFMLSLF